MAFLLQVRMFWKTTAAVFIGLTAAPAPRHRLTPPFAVHLRMRKEYRICEMPKRAKSVHRPIYQVLKKVITFSPLDEQSHRKTTSWLP
ncbi:hypothetical protein [Azospirillum argentinense]